MRSWHKKQGHTELCHKQLKSLLTYNPETGLFRHTQNGNPRMAGKIAGRLDYWGYTSISLYGRSYRAHRLAWFYVHGQWPAGELDHADGQPWNNSIANLRPATRSQNQANRRVTFDSRTKAKGVTRSSVGGYEASVTCEGTTHYLGRFPTVREASAAYYAAARRYFGEFARESTGIPEVYVFPHGTSRRKRGLPPLKVDALEKRSFRYRQKLDD